MIEWYYHLMKDSLFQECVKNRKYIFNYFYRITGYDRELSEDLTQQTFLKMFTFFKKYDIQHKPYLTTWSLKVAKNIYYDFLRKKRDILECDIIFQIDESFSFDNFVSNANVETELEKRDLKRKIDIVLDELSPQQKEALDILKLHAIKKLDYEEISKIKNKSNDSCRAASCRIKKVLRNKLSETLLF